MPTLLLLLVLPLDLRPLRGIEPIVIEVIANDHEKHGLSKSLLQLDTAVTLRKAGVRVATSSSEDSPVLRVNVLSYKLTGEVAGFSYCIEMGLYQAVFLMKGGRPLGPLKARTWESWAKVGTSPPNVLNEQVRGGLKDLLDQFVNDYLAANPKP
jgi:hypothetical protein